MTEIFLWRNTGRTSNRLAGRQGLHRIPLDPRSASLRITVAQYYERWPHETRTLTRLSRKMDLRPISQADTPAHQSTSTESSDRLDKGIRGKGAAAACDRPSLSFEVERRDRYMRPTCRVVNQRLSRFHFKRANSLSPVRTNMTNPAHNYPKTCPIHDA